MYIPYLTHRVGINIPGPEADRPRVRYVYTYPRGQVRYIHSIKVESIPASSLH